MMKIAVFLALVAFTVAAPASGYNKGYAAPEYKPAYQPEPYAAPAYHAKPAYQPAPSYHKAASQYKPSYQPAPAYGGYGKEYYDDKPAEYKFAYAVKDEYYNDFGHEEARNGYDTNGVYYVLLPDGRRQTVNYKADEYGYNADVQYDGEAKYGGDYKQSPSYHKPSYKPAYPEPSYHKPAYPEPSYHKPAYPEPSYHKPSYKPAYKPAPYHAAPAYQPAYQPEPAYGY